MSILSWLEANLLLRVEHQREQDVQRLSSDLRKLKAEAEALRAKGRILRQEIAEVLAAR